MYWFGFSVPLNTFHVISVRCLPVTEGMITTLRCCITESEISHSRHAVVWYPVRSHYSGNGSSSFCVEYVEHLASEESFDYRFHMYMYLNFWNVIYIHVNYGRNLSFTDNAIVIHVKPKYFYIYRGDIYIQTRSESW